MTREAFETEARKHGFILDRLDKSGVYVQLITEQAASRQGQHYRHNPA